VEARSECSPNMGRPGLGEEGKKIENVKEEQTTCNFLTKRRAKRGNIEKPLPRQTGREEEWQYSVEGSSQEYYTGGSVGQSLKGKNQRYLVIVRTLCRYPKRGEMEPGNTEGTGTQKSKP